MELTSPNGLRISPLKCEPGGQATQYFRLSWYRSWIGDYDFDELFAWLNAYDTPLDELETRPYVLCQAVDIIHRQTCTNESVYDMVLPTGIAVRLCDPCCETMRAMVGFGERTILASEVPIDSPAADAVSRQALVARLMPMMAGR